MADLRLAGLNAEDVASAAHPYLHLAALQARQASGAAARRARTARYTPGGLAQPPEVMGVDADARVPNPQQPMSGEFGQGREIGDWRPAYFGALMPAPTGVTNGAGVANDHPFGAPMAAPIALPATAADRGLAAGNAARDQLAALPRFAVGGLLAPGGAGRRVKPRLGV
ncbi:MAG: hypothetical protein ACRD1E_01335 [Terriglobales bacterium]